MTTANAGGSRIDRDAKIASWKEHVADIDQHIAAMKAFNTQAAAWLDTVKRNIDATVSNWITGMEANKKTLQAKINAGV